MLSSKKIITLFILNTLSNSLLADAISFKQGGIDSPDTRSNFTDDEKEIVDNYLHEGYIQRSYDEKCKENTETYKACLGQDVDPKFLGMKSSMVKALSKAYSMIIVAGAGGDLETTKDNENLTSDKNGEAEATSGKKEEEVDNTDYCKYIAAGTEAVTLVQTQMSQSDLNKLPTNQETFQKDQLYKAAENHNNRAKTAKIQTGGWGATTACYGAMIARPGISATSWSNLLKLGAAGLLTTFFYNEIGAHEKYRDKVKEIADGLPGKGDCNPVTQIDCYCAQEETKNDPKYCMGPTANYVMEKDLPTVCLDDSLEADPSCRCLSTNSCYDKMFEENIAALNLGRAFQEEAVDPFNKISRGELKSGSVKGDSKNYLAIAKKHLNEIAKKLPEVDQSSLDDAQKEEVLVMESMGIPMPLAAKLAASPSSAKGESFAKGFLGNVSSDTLGKGSNSGRANILKFSGGKGSFAEKTRKKEKNNPFDSFMKKKKDNKKYNNVLKYANKALEKAEINTNSRDQLFEIISRRYRTSGRKRLGF